MGETLKLEASDGHSLDAYVAMPEGAPRGGVVIVQEIFGVNHHIRAVCDRVAQEGAVVRRRVLRPLPGRARVGVARGAAGRPDGPE